jgi:hypothetical protein
MKLKNEIPPLIKKIEITRNIFFSLAFITLVLSITTVFWTITEARINIEYKNTYYSDKNTVANGNLGRYGGTFSWPSIEYEFDVAGEIYTNSIVCLCIPIGLNIDSSNQHVNIHYLAFAPDISIIKTGPHFLLTITLIFLGLFFNALSYKLKKINKNPRGKPSR